MLGLLLGSTVSGPAWAADPVEAARAVVEAVAREDRATLRRIAADGGLEHWFVTDELLALGEAEAATAYLDLVPRPDAEDARRYVANAPPESAEARLAYEKARAALRRGADQEALDQLRGARPPPESILAARIAILDAVILRRQGKLVACLDRFRDTGDMAEALGWLGLETAARTGLVQTAERLFDYESMLEGYQRLVVLHAALGKPLREAEARVNLAGVLSTLGDTAAALDEILGAYETFRDLAAARRLAETAANVSLLFARQGAYAHAVDWLDASEPHWASVPRGEAYAHFLAQVGAVRLELGDHVGASEKLEEALEIHGEARTPAKADVLGQLGLVLLQMGKHEDALGHLEEALEIHEELEDVVGQANVLRVTAAVRLAQGNSAEALALYEAATHLPGTDAHTAGVARLRLGEAQVALNRPREALVTLGEARLAVRALQARDLEAQAQRAFAEAHLLLGDATAASAYALKAIELLDLTIEGLADEPMVRVRENRSRMLNVAQEAALATGDVSVVMDVLERSRARALLDAYGGRVRIRGAGLPDELADAEVSATTWLAAAHRRYRRARRSGLLDEMRAARGEIRDAEGALLDVKRRVQRLAKRVAGVTHPSPPDLDALRADLGGGTVLLSYVLRPDRVYAVLVSTDGERIVDLGPTAPVVEACDTLAADGEDETEAVLARLASLRSLLLDPLELDADTERLVVSPDGALCYLPWPALVDEALVACVPSATTHSLLRSDAGLRGEGVLAIGDPAYAQGAGDELEQVYFRGRPLSDLEATRTEVEAITGEDDEVLLDVEATEGGLRAALGLRERWRAVHFACHGLVDPDVAVFSALALTPDENDDGFLTTLELLDLSIPTDIVVLSACETGRGAFRRGEGVMGLTRAFMVAGAPRVVVSLWPVDDEATARFMTLFYEAWQEPGTSAATALRDVQRRFRDGEEGDKWRHPAYWAAWVLWGLPD
jgi:tetratricopeptide (TPR) repeat protein